MGDGASHRCSFARPDGSRCGANALRGSDPPLCFFHSPDAKRARGEARRTGGRKRSRPAATLPPGEPDAGLGTVAQATAFLARVANATARGVMDPRVTNATVYALSTLVNALLKGDHEERLRRVEEALAAVDALKKGRKR